MPQYRRSIALFSIILSAVLEAAFPLVASAGINDVPSPLATTTTNPWNSEPDSWWRQGWGNSTTPDFTLNKPSAEPEVLGMLYAVDRNRDTEIDETQSAAYDHAWSADGTALSHDLDILGIYGSNPALFATTEPAARLPFEGRWQFHWSFFSNSEIASRTITADFGIDVTPPLPVTKLVSRPYVDYAGATSGVWFDSRRAYIVWEDKEYDALSGTAAYEIWLNDERLEYTYHLDHTYTAATIEDLAAGKNKIAVKTVDRATNTAPATVTYFYSDPDVPVVAITKPAVGAYVGKAGSFEATATDGAGIQSVRFYIDGTLIFTDTTVPYGVAKDMSAYATGTHQLKVIAKDMLGREVTQARDFTLDKTPAQLLSVSDGPDPFYPHRAEGYKDFSTVNFWSNERIYAYVYYYKANGDVFTGRSGARLSGWSQFRWNGQSLDDSDGVVHPEVGLGTYRYRVILVDRAGNQTVGALQTTTIRDYELVRIAGNAVMVIAR